MQSQISDAKNKLRSAEDYRQLVGSYFEQTVADVYEHYERELHRMNAMDFDDLLVRSVNLLELFQEVRDRYASAFRWILVDEYQDTNHAQYRWLQLLASEHRNLAVVGDDDQCLVDGTPITMGDGSIKPIEDVRAGRRGPVVATAAATSGPRGSPRRSSRSAPMGIEITTRRRPASRQHARAHALRRLPRRATRRRMHMTYLMWRRDMGCRVGTTRTRQPRGQDRGTESRSARWQEHADAAWVAVDARHRRRRRALRRQLCCAARIGIPTLPFVARPARSANGVVGDQDLHRRASSRASTRSARGLRLLRDDGLDFEDPHHLPRAFDGRRRNVTLTLCGGPPRPARRMHTVVGRWARRGGPRGARGRWA